MAEGLDATRALLPDKPIWITETSMALGDGVDEAEPARLVAVLTGVAAVHGAERLFWHTLSDPPPRTDGPGGAGGFATNSLMRTLQEGGREDSRRRRSTGTSRRRWRSTTSSAPWRTARARRS